jgi:hypothetical protein
VVEELDDGRGARMATGSGDVQSGDVQTAELFTVPWLQTSVYEQPAVPVGLAVDHGSRASIEARIRAGYADAVAQGIGSPRAPGLRIGTVAAHEAPVPA